MAATKRKQAAIQKDYQPGAAKRRRATISTEVEGNRTRKAQQLDNLSWKNVILPDRLDDYEGFFGLEEVDDVDVVRDHSSGKVSFLAPAGTEAFSEDDVSGSEWNGFEDETPINKLSTNDLNDPKVVKASNNEGAPTKLRNKKDSKPGAVGGAFTHLTEAESGIDVDVSEWRGLKLSPDTLAALAKLKFSNPTPIQKRSIPEMLQGHDVIGKASTGSGKTLAYGIPILERFLERKPNKKPGASPLALILSPTRELAHQITHHLQSLCNSGIFDGPNITTVTGGLSMQKQQRLIKGADIIIGTPGRLWEVVSAGNGLLAAIKQVQFLVVDEADRLLSEGHFQEAEEIINALDKEVVLNEDLTEETTPLPMAQTSRQTLVFSATFDRSLQRKLAGKSQSGSNMLSNEDAMQYLLGKLKFREEPRFIDVNPVAQMASGLKEGLVECPAGTDKDLYLYATLLLNVNLQILVFTNSITAVRRLVPFLQNLNLPALGLHSGMPQKARLRSVERFSDNKRGSILVATDVAARGLDIPNIQLVLHYHLPRQADMYVHRSGRTARAGNVGSSIILCAPEEVAGVRRLVAKVHAQAAIANESKAGIDEARRQGFYIRTLDIDRKVVARLKPRATLAKKIADTQIAVEKGKKEDNFLKQAAEELGVDYDSDEFEAQGSKGRRGRGAGRMKKEKEAKGLSKAEVASMKSELKSLLKQRVNVGVSEKYIASGRVDVDELLRQQEAGGRTGEFLGDVGSLGLDN